MLSGGEHLQAGGKVTWLNKVWAAMTKSEVTESASSYQSQRALHATATKVVNVQHQIERLQSQHNLEMIRLAQAYQAMPLLERNQLPEKLRVQLDRIESEYF